VVAVVTDQILPAQGGDGLLVAMHALAVRVVGIEKRVKGQVRHAARVVGPALQVGQDLPLELFCFLGWKSRFLQALGQDVKQEAKIVSQGFPAKADRVHATAETQPGSHRLQGVVDLAKTARLGAAQEHTCRKTWPRRPAPVLR
jgi:hypothetical protein